MVRFSAAVLVSALALWIAPVAADPHACSRLEVTDPRGGAPSMEGTYRKTSLFINDAPVWQAETTWLAAPDRYKHNYLYRHRVDFTESGLVWVVQPELPDASEWRGNAYGDGGTPELAAWIDGIRVRCLDTVHTPVPRHASPDKTIDIAVVYTLDAETRASREGYCKGRESPECGIDTHARQAIDTLNTALRDSGVEGGFFRIVHLGPINLFSTEVRALVDAHAPALELLTGAEKRGMTASEIEAEDNRRRLKKASDDLFFANNLFTEPAIVDGKYRYRDFIPFSIRELHGRRKAFGADVVHVILGDLKGGCGVGVFALKRESEGVATVPADAYSLTRLACDSHGLAAAAHEIGHTLGLKHTPQRLANSSESENVGAQRGYADPTNGFVTLMGYPIDCGGVKCSVVPLFSSPDVTIRSRNGTEVAVGSRRSNAVDHLNKRGMRMVALYGGDAPKVPSFWPPATRSGVINDVLPLTPGDQMELPYFLYNPTGDDMLIQDFSGSGTGGLANFSVDSGFFMPCRKNHFLRAGDACSLSVSMTANDRPQPVSYEFAVLVEYLSHGSREPKSVIGTLHYSNSTP